MKRNKFIIILAILLITITGLLVYNYIGIRTDNSDSSESTVTSSLAATKGEPDIGESINNLTESKWGSQNAFDGSTPIIRNMKELLSITAIPRRHQGEKPPTSKEVFASWVGQLDVTVKKAVLYKTLEDTGLPADGFSGYQEAILSDTEHEYIPLVIELDITNVSAESYLGDNSIPASERKFDGMIFQISSKNEFSQESFKVNEDTLAVASWLPMVYMSPREENSEENSYWAIELAKGETKQMELCALIETSASLVPLDELYLEVKTDSDNHIFGVRLNDIIKEE